MEILFRLYEAGVKIRTDDFCKSEVQSLPQTSAQASGPPFLLRTQLLPGMGWYLGCSSDLSHTEVGRHGGLAQFPQ